jgi:post-segregation antitoxin (ccd killing protein)
MMRTAHVNLQLLQNIRVTLRLILNLLKLDGIETAIVLEELASEIRQKLARQWDEENPG